MLCCYSSIAGAGLHQAGWFPCRKNTRAADVLSFQRDPRHAGGGALAVTRLECLFSMRSEACGWRWRFVQGWEGPCVGQRGNGPDLAIDLASAVLSQTRN